MHASSPSNRENACQRGIAGGGTHTMTRTPIAFAIGAIAGAALCLTVTATPTIAQLAMPLTPEQQLEFNNETIQAIYQLYQGVYHIRDVIDQQERRVEKLEEFQKAHLEQHYWQQLQDGYSNSGGRSTP
jgi:hypothetical protein